jgi:hypothetical protein
MFTAFSSCHKIVSLTSGWNCSSIISLHKADGSLQQSGKTPKRQNGSCNRPRATDPKQQQAQSEKGNRNKDGDQTDSPK